MGPMFQARSRVIELIVVAALSASAALPAFASEVHRFDIPAEEAPAAIRDFAAQAHVQILVAGEKVKGKRLHSVSGSLSTDQGLQQLLQGSGLVPQYVGDRSIALLRAGEAEKNAAKSVAHAADTDADNSADVPSREGHSNSFRLAQGNRGSAAQGTAINAAAVAASDSPARLEEIVVTANKRSETVQSVAAGISVESGEQLIARSQAQLTDYAAYMPGFYVNNGGSPGQASVTLRGISSLTSGSAVATYIDETPLGSSSNWNNASAQILDLLPYDLERLEVLRGPQGTLYGAGSMGGLIKYVLKAPNAGDYEARVGADISYVNGAGQAAYDVHGRFNAPLIPDVLGASLSLFDRYTPGYIDNAYNGARDTNGGRSYGGRLAVLWQPTDQVSAKLSWLEYRTASYDNSYESFAAVQVPSSDGADIVKAGSSFGDLTQNHAYPQLFHKNVSAYALTVDWNPGPVDVVSATGYSRQRADVSSDFSINYGSLPLLFGEPAGLAKGNFNYGIDKLTQEVRVVSPQGQLVDWLAGVFYTHERSTDDQYGLLFTAAGQPDPAFAPNFYEGHLPTTYSEVAGFGDVTWHVIQSFDVTGGVRVARNTQNFSDFTGGALASAPGTIVVPQSSQSVVTWSFDSRYRFAPDDMLYARIAKGYRAGSPNTPGVGVPQTVGSDTLINYELGIKSQFLDRKALVDVAGFWIDWSNIQMGASKNGFGYYANAGDANSKGFELTSTYSPIEAVTFGFNAAYTRSKLTSVASNTNFLTGYQLPYVPEWSFSATADYNWVLSAGWDAKVGGGVRWLDQEYLGAVEFGPAAIPSVQAPAYTVLDLNASVHKGPLAIRLFGRNLTNRRAIQGVNPQSDNILGGVKQLDFAILQPRTVGLGVDYSF